MGKILRSSLALCLSVAFLIPSFSEAIGAIGDELSAQADALYAKAIYQDKRKKALDKYLEAVEAYKAEENYADASRNLALAGNILADMGEFKRALDSYKTAMEFAQSADEPDLYNHARLSEGIVLLKMGKVDEALKALDQALENCDTNDEDFCRAILASAIALEMLGGIDSAEESLKDALETAKEIGHLELQANCLNRLARLELYRGKYEKAIDMWDEAFKLAWESAKKEPRKLSEAAKISGTKGKGYLAMGQSLRAMESFQGAVNAYHKAGMPRHEAAALEDLVQASFLSDKIGTALVSLQQAIEIKSTLGIPTDGVFAQAANFFMDCYKLNAATQYVKKTDNLLVRARFALWRGNLEEAHNLYKDALVESDSNGSELGQFAAYTGMGVVCERMGDRISHPDADAVLQKMEHTNMFAISKLKGQGLQENWIAIYTRYMIAYKNLVDGLSGAKLNRDSRERLKPYKAVYENGLAEIRKITPKPWNTKLVVPNDKLKSIIEPLHFTAAKAREMLVEQDLTAIERREYSKFYDAYWLAWRHFNEIAFSAEELELLDRAASLKIQPQRGTTSGASESARNWYRESAENYSKAVVLTESVRLQLDSEDKGRFLNFRISGFRRTAAHEGYARIMVKTGQPEEAFKFSDFTKARSFAESLERRKLGQAMKVPDHVIDYEAKVTATLDSKRKNGILLRSIGSSAETIKKCDGEIKTLENDLDEFRKQTAKNFPAFAAVADPKTMDLMDSALKPEEFSLAYDVTDLGTIVYELRGKQIINASLVPVSRNWMNRMIAAVRETSEDDGLSGLYHNSENQSTYQWLIYMNNRNWNVHGLPKLLGKMLLGNFTDQMSHGSRLLIIPDESFYILPFQALRIDAREGKTSLDGNSTEFLQDRVAVHYYPSVRALTDLRNRATANVESPTRTLILADHREDWSVEEAEYIRKLNPQATDCYVGLPKSDFLLKKDLRPYRYLILMGHGAEGTELFETGILLSLKGKTGNDADIMYQTHEFMQLSLNADLVCFPTCSTGIAEAIAGEVMMSLGTVALYAGSKSAIMTLWPVGEYTCKLEEYFFPMLYKGEPKLQALWNSHNLVWDDFEDAEDLAKWRCPTYWAPFILIGEAD